MHAIACFLDESKLSMSFIVMKNFPIQPTCPRVELRRNLIFSKAFNQPPLGPAVLKPGFDLCVGHLQAFRQGGPFGAGQILLPMESLLQLTDLDAGERRAGLFPFGRCSVLVRVPYPPGDGERHQSCWKEQRERNRCAMI